MLQVNIDNTGGMKLHLDDFQKMYEEMVMMVRVLACSLFEYLPNPNLAPLSEGVVLTGLIPNFKTNTVTITPGYFVSFEGYPVPVPQGATLPLKHMANGTPNYIYIEVSEVIVASRKIEATGEVVPIMKRKQGVLKQTTDVNEAQAPGNTVLFKNRDLQLPKIQKLLHGE